MLIGISGTLGSGKSEVARYLSFQGFRYIDFERDPKDATEVFEGLNLKEATPNEHGLKPELNFPNLEALIDHVTKNWRSNFVLTDITSLDQLERLAKRPFFLHLSIDAPLKLRYERNKKNCPGLSFVEFVEVSDAQEFDKRSMINEINSKAAVKVINTSTEVENLYAQLSEINLLDQSRLRPTWDSYFMQIADLAAKRSNCMKRRVGCVIARDKRVIATGYNGTPRHLTNCNEGGCSRCNSGNGSGAGLSTCLCLHAEENALLESGRDRIGQGSILYCNTCPCLTCSIKIVQCGIKEVVYSQSYSMDELSSKVFEEGNVLLRQFIPPKDEVIA